MAKDKPSSAAVEAATSVVIIAPQPTPVTIADDVDKIRRARLDKELMGIRAKLRWTHITDGAKAELALRATVIEQELKA